MTGIVAEARLPDTLDDGNGTHNHGYIVSYGNDHAGDDGVTVDARDDD